MPRSGSGTYTLPSGNPVVTGTTIESNWANTTLSDIATTLSDSLSRSGQGGMTAALRVADGTQGAPGVGFANETGSGFYRAGTGEVWAVVQGAQTLNLDANGVTVPSDKATSIEGTFVFNETGADKDARFEGDTDANLLFVDASTDRVGVGTSTPDAKLTVNGVGAFGAGAVGTPSISNTGDLNTGIWFPAADTVAVSTGGAEVARFDSSGNLGLGVTPTSGWEASVAMQFSSEQSYGKYGYTRGAYYDGSTYRSISTLPAAQLQIAGGGFLFKQAAASTAGAAITLSTSMTLDSSGNLGLGVTPSAWGALFKAVQLPGGSVWADSNNLYASSNTYYNGTNYIYKNSTYATSYEQAGGTHVWKIAASGTAGNAISFTQAMTLTAAGNLLVGRTSSAGAAYSLELDNNSTDNRIGMYVSGTLTGGLLATTNEIRMLGLGASTVLTFQTNGSERARITSGGDLLVGTTSAAGAGGITLQTGANGFALINNNNAAATGYVFGSFRRSSVEIGSITQNGTTAVAYNTTSDHRLKENVTPLTGAIAKVQALKPSEFDWIDGRHDDGFIAHELQAVLPNVVAGEKDAVDENGNPKYQQVDYARIVPTLTAAIQEQQAIITALTARVAALEAQP